MADFDVLDVRLHGESIGTLTRLGRDRIVFAFDPSYMDDSARATLSLSFKDPFGHLITDIPPTRTRATRSSRTFCRRGRYGSTSPGVPESIRDGTSRCSARWARICREP